jgi:thioredoxin reductase (NADPH)
VRTYQRVEDVAGGSGDWFVTTRTLTTDEPLVYRARSLILATGYYDNPNLLGVPGEELPKVSHYYTEGHPHFGRDVAVVGGGNSAVEAALDLFRNGARVTLIHRRAELSPSLKYWVAPDIHNRIEAREICALLSTRVVAIESARLRLCHEATGETRELPNDFVFALTGYHPDTALLERLGVAFDGETLAPVVDSETLESNVPGLFLAGVVVAGRDANRVFIENARFHGECVVRALVGRARR